MWPQAINSRTEEIEIIQDTATTIVRVTIIWRSIRETSAVYRLRALISTYMARTTQDRVTGELLFPMDHFTIEVRVISKENIQVFPFHCV